MLTEGVLWLETVIVASPHKIREHGKKKTFRDWLWYLEKKLNILMDNSFLNINSARHPNNQSTNIGTGRSFATAEFASFVHNLIKSWEYVVFKLDLHNQPHAFSRCINCCTNNTLLSQRCVENPV